MRLLTLGLVLLVGCGPRPTAPGEPEEDIYGNDISMSGAGSSPGKSDLDKVRSADISILFVGNSHTRGHNLPNLIGKMIQFRHPDKKVYSHYFNVIFLEDVARNPRCKEEIDSRPWKYVVLQAQKISVSGREDYSRKEGIDIAKLAKARGATVLFYSEWGLKGVEGDGLRQEKIYQEMAQDAGVRVAPIGRAWDLALGERPEMALHAPDGNHQSRLGAFLTACVFYGLLTGESPEELASFPYLKDEEVSKFLADAAARTLARLGKDGGKP